MQNVMLARGLSDLGVAFAALARSGGGDLGGLRSKLNNDIAGAAKDVLDAITDSIAHFQARRSGAAPPASSCGR
jgi:hypothetical protein